MRRSAHYPQPVVTQHSRPGADREGARPRLLELRAGQAVRGGFYALPEKEDEVLLQIRRK
jgi:hypothetical protein